MYIVFLTLFQSKALSDWSWCWALNKSCLLFIIYKDKKKRGDEMYHYVYVVQYGADCVMWSGNVVTFWCAMNNSYKHILVNVHVQHCFLVYNEQFKLWREHVFSFEGGKCRNGESIWKADFPFFTNLFAINTLLTFIIITSCKTRLQFPSNSALPILLLTNNWQESMLNTCYS